MALRKPDEFESFPAEAGGIAYERRHGRGAQTNRSGRFEPVAYEPADDGWDSLGDLDALVTEVQDVPARRIIAKNTSPDIGFDRSINPYRGCEHGCIYCHARPTHAFLGLSPGLDFETKLFAKTNAAQALERELAEPNYRPQMIAIGTNTDPYQPIERRYRIMRRILEVLSAANHPVGIVTKSALVLRDLDILQSMAERGLVKVALSVTTLDHRLARAMEPRASTPEKRIEAIEKLSAAGVPTSIMFAPVIPGLTDAEMERILERGSVAGAREAGYILLRLPLEIGDLFTEWLRDQLPGPGETRAVADAPDPRRQALRRDMGRAHGRRRALCLDDRPPIRDGVRAARPEHEEARPPHRSVHAPCEARPAAPPALSGFSTSAGSLGSRGHCQARAVRATVGTSWACLHAHFPNRSCRASISKPR